MILGLSGKIGTGKSTLMDYVVKRALKNNNAFLRISFGDLLKEEVSKKFDIPLLLCYSQEGKKTTLSRPDFPRKNMSIREVLQWWGTDVRRKENPDYWVEEMEKVTNKSSAPVILIDDVRFLNEAEFTLLDGQLDRINPYPGWKPGPYANHVSETELDDFPNFTHTFYPEYGKLSLFADVVYLAIQDYFYR